MKNKIEETKHTPEFVKQKMIGVAKDYFVDCAPATIEINAPRALMQCKGEGILQGIDWMLNQSIYAAAPELLEMLYLALPSVEESDEFNKPTHKLGQKVRVLLSKAEGVRP